MFCIGTEYEGFSIGLVYTHNNQPCNEKGEGDAKDLSIYLTLIQQVPIEFSRWQILVHDFFNHHSRLLQKRLRKESYLDTWVGDKGDGK